MTAALRLQAEALDRLRRELHDGRSEAFENYLNASARFFPYGWRNCLLIADQRPGVTHLAGAGDWRALGRPVRRGETGITLFDEAEGPRSRQGTGEWVPNERALFVPFRNTVVYDVRQTSGPPWKMEHDPAELSLLRLRDLLVKAGAHFEYVSAMAARPVEPTASGLRVLRGLRPGEEFAALSHQLARQMLHDGRLIEPASDRAATRQAGAVAFVVCRGVGVEPSKPAAEFVPEFMGRAGELGTALWRLHEVSSQILTELVPERELDLGRSGSPREPAADRGDALLWDR